jgi:NADPH2:quinone reductase
MNPDPQTLPVIDSLWNYGDPAATEEKFRAILSEAAAGDPDYHAQLLTQIARMRGATVIGTVSTEAKAQAARVAGAQHTINYATSDFVAEVKRITDGRGVDVIYDAVGADTFLRGFECIRPRGMMVS